jgi:hypothetical protein
MARRRVRPVPPPPEDDDQGNLFGGGSPPSKKQPEKHPADEDDITKNFHGGNPFSVRANRDTHPRKQAAKDRIHDGFIATGPAGKIAEAIYRPLGICDNTGTARCSELKRDGRLLGTSREALSSTGSAAQVLVADCYRAQNPDIVPYVSRRKKA